MTWNRIDDLMPPRGRVVILFAVTDWGPNAEVHNWRKSTGSWNFDFDEYQIVWTWEGRRLEAWDAKPSHWCELPDGPEEYR